MQQEVDLEMNGQHLFVPSVGGGVSSESGSMTMTMTSSAYTGQRTTKEVEIMCKKPLGEVAPHSDVTFISFEGGEEAEEGKEEEKGRWEEEEEVEGEWVELLEWGSSDENRGWCQRSSVLFSNLSRRGNFKPFFLKLPERQWWRVTDVERSGEEGKEEEEGERGGRWRRHVRKAGQSVMMTFREFKLLLT